MWYVRMKKKILFLHYNMELGGVETSLLGLLDSIDYEKYDVDLFLYSHSGGLLPLINEHVRLLPEVKAYQELTCSIRRNFTDGFFGIGTARVYAKLRSAFSKGPLRHPHNYKQYFHKLCLPFLPGLPGEYDLAISFNDPHFIIGKRVKSKIKMSWFHTDASRIDFCDEIEKEMWGLSDYVVTVSEDCKRAFDRKHPYLRNKSIVIENILSQSFILTQSEKYEITDEMPSDGCIKLLSIGRFTTPKNFDNVPDICRRMISAGLNIKWYLIGYGGDEGLIREKIIKAGMEKRVIILGKKENPYPYIKACDLYVQPSRYEGKCVAVREAQMLGKPVVITHYATAESQLTDGIDGVIVPMDNEGCADGIASLLRDTERMQLLIDHTKQRDYTNREYVEKIFELAAERSQKPKRSCSKEEADDCQGKISAERSEKPGTVSVIIPVYKVEKYLSECVDSVINQTYDNLQIILVDDGSPDLCGQICERYMEQDSRILVIRKENGGLSDARNAGMKKASGEFVYFLDSDDWIEPDTIERLVEAQERTDADMVFSGFYYTYPDREDQAKDCFGQESLLMNFEAMQALAEGSIQTFAWGKLVRASIAKRYEFPVGKLFEDHFWTHRVLGDAKKVLFTPGAYVRYRQREDSISFSCDLKRLDILKGWYCRIRFFEQRYPELALLYKKRVAGDFVNLAWLVLTRMRKHWREAFGRLRAFSKKTELATYAEGADRKLIRAIEKNVLCYACAAAWGRLRR